MADFENAVRILSEGGAAAASIPLTIYAVACLIREMVPMVEVILKHIRLIKRVEDLSDGEKGIVQTSSGLGLPETSSRPL